MGAEDDYADPTDGDSPPHPAEVAGLGVILGVFSGLALAAIVCSGGLHYFRF